MTVFAEVSGTGREVLVSDAAVLKASGVAREVLVTTGSTPGTVLLVGETVREVLVQDPLLPPLQSSRRGPPEDRPEERVAWALTPRFVPSTVPTAVVAPPQQTQTPEDRPEDRPDWRATRFVPTAVVAPLRTQTPEDRPEERADWRATRFVPIFVDVAGTAREVLVSEAFLTAVEVSGTGREVLVSDAAVLKASGVAREVLVTTGSTPGTVLLVGETVREVLVQDPLPNVPQWLSRRAPEDALEERIDWSTRRATRLVLRARSRPFLWIAM